MTILYIVVLLAQPDDAFIMGEAPWYGIDVAFYIILLLIKVAILYLFVWLVHKIRTYITSEIEKIQLQEEESRVEEYDFSQLQSFRAQVKAFFSMAIASTSLELIQVLLYFIIDTCRSKLSVATV